MPPYASTKIIIGTFSIQKGENPAVPFKKLNFQRLVKMQNSVTPFTFLKSDFHASREIITLA